MAVKEIALRHVLVGAFLGFSFVGPSICFVVVFFFKYRFIVETQGEIVLKFSLIFMLH